MMNLFNFIPEQLHIETLQYPWVLSFLILIPIIGWFSFRHSEYSVRSLFIPSKHAITNNQTKPFSRFRQKLSLRWFAAALALLLMTGCFILMTLAVARPYGHSIYSSNTKGSDIYFVLDMSASMRAYDGELDEIQRQYYQNETIYNRYDIARQAIMDFIDDRAQHCRDIHFGSRCDRIGIALFGQKAFIDVPLTTNYQLLREHLNQRRIDDIDASQSAIGDGIMRAIASLRHSQAYTRTIVLFTDGDRKGGRISVEQALAAADEYHVTIYPFLAGKQDKAILSQLNPNGQRVFYEATFPVNRDLLQSIAQKTQGSFFQASDPEEYRTHFQTMISKLDTSISSIDDLDDQIDLTPFFMQLALILGLVACCIYYLFVKKYP